jgi:mono/diheme cytochrome c family protein
MLANLLGLLILLMIAVLFGWLAVRAARSRRRLFRWIGTPLAALPALLVLLVSGAAARGLYILNVPHNFPVPAAPVAGTAEQLARGEHLAQVICAVCHSPDGALPLRGAAHSLSEDARLPLGDIWPPNLTPGGEIAQWSDGEILRAMRLATHANGRPLLMPVQRLKNLSDDDALAIIAYLRRQPSVARSTPPTRPSLLLAIFLGAGLFNVDATPIAGPIIAPPKAATIDYGAYLVSFADCRDCHGDKLDGHPSGPVPPGPSLRIVQGWTQEQFKTTLRTGVDPSGHALQPPMPWRQYGQFDDVELAAIYAYLQSLPPVQP